MESFGQLSRQIFKEKAKILPGNFDRQNREQKFQSVAYWARARSGLPDVDLFHGVLLQSLKADN